MKPASIRLALTVLASSLGVLLLGTAVLARELGIDHDASWGKSRVFLAVLGGLLVLLTLGIHFQGTLTRTAGSAHQRLSNLPGVVHLGRAFARIWAWLTQNTLILFFVRLKNVACSWLGKRKLVAFFAANPDRQAGLYAGLIVAAGILAYLGIATGGRITVWPSVSNYFDLQAEAFLAGQVALPVQPDPALLALPNPYDYRLRENVPTFWDASLYNGRYYLYWGPTPALVAALLKVTGLAPHPHRVDDSILVVLFLSGLLIASAALIVFVRRRLFTRLPAWMVILPISAAAFANPVPFLLRRPSVYEVAITGGQFFLVAGIFFAFTAVSGGRPVLWKSVLAGACWALAVGSRTNLAPAVIWLAVLFAGYLLILGKKTFQTLQLGWTAMVLGVPLLLGAAGLGWYNFARFGSVLEVGHRYQLTGPALPADYSKVISAAYALPNLYNYFFRPFAVEQLFPFLSAPWIKEAMWPFFIRLPRDYYYSEPVTGLLPAVPYLVLGLIALAAAIRPILRRILAANPGFDRDHRWGTPAEPHFLWLCAGLAGAALTEAASILIFISSSMRYELDIQPALLMLACLGVFAGTQALAGRSGWRRLFLISTTAVLLASLGIGLLLAYSG